MNGYYRWRCLSCAVPVMLFFFIVFCAAGAAAAASKELERVRIGYSVGGLIPFPLIVAKENRFFEQAGFDAELINIPPTIAVTALVSGDIQYVIWDTFSASRAPGFSDRLLGYAERYDARAVHVETLPIATADGRTARKAARRPARSFT